MAWLRNSNVVPVLIVLAAIVVFWYAMAVQHERAVAADAQRARRARPMCRSPSSRSRPGRRTSRCCRRRIRCSPRSGTRRSLETNARRSLVTHSWVTLSATLCGLRARHAARHRAGGGDRPQRCVGPLADAVDHREPDGADPRDRADGGGGARGGRGHRARAQGADLDVSQLLPGRRRHGEGAALAGADPARPDAHLQCERLAGVLPSCAGRRRCRSSSPR